MYHEKIAKKFGSDLFDLLGPKETRGPWNSLSLTEQTARINRIPEYVNTRSLGSHPTFVDMLCFCFQKLVNMGDDNPLRGIDLPEFSSLSEAAEKMDMPAMNYDPTNLHHIVILVKNAAKQRDIFLRHIFADIVFRFNPGLVFPGIGRMNSKGQLFVNDAQHRTLACMILGIEQVPLSFIRSDDEYWDVSQYAAINIHSLSASPFDHYRIRVQRATASEEANMPIEKEDKICKEMDVLFNELEIVVVEKKDTVGSNSKVLTGIGNMVKYRKDYSKDAFERAVTINAVLFPTCVFQTANSWGLMEFLEHQDKRLDKKEFDYKLRNALRKAWQKPNQGNRLHKDIKDCYKDQTDSEANNSRVPEPVIIAHGIWQVCKKYEPDGKWVEPPWPAKMQKFTMDLV
jgi:hypothetical protein